MEGGVAEKQSSYTYWVRETKDDAAPLPVPRKLTPEDISKQSQPVSLGSVWNQLHFCFMISISLNHFGCFFNCIPAATYAAGVLVLGDANLVFLPHLNYTPLFEISLSLLCSARRHPRCRRPASHPKIRARIRTHWRQTNHRRLRHAVHVPTRRPCLLRAISQIFKTDKEVRVAEGIGSTRILPGRNPCRTLKVLVQFSRRQHNTARSSRTAQSRCHVQLFIRAGTWEEKNLNSWANGRIKELLSSMSLEFSKGKAAIDEVTKCSGDLFGTLSPQREVGRALALSNSLGRINIERPRASGLERIISDRGGLIGSNQVDQIGSGMGSLRSARIRPDRGLIGSDWLKQDVSWIERLRGYRGEWSIKDQKEKIKGHVDIPEFSFGELDDLKIESRISNDISAEVKAQISEDLQSFLEPIRKKLSQFEQELKDR
ncbi:hypothetical protein MA16_Dca016057 [Dendrobium catenatum]|uniref:Activator of Hsp90 ATPase AHSA1-like N-terminal domain-containing protein n=1 Tax=Dendrobium catenatum TaxID=906689 RepID=A0A2I0VEM4_9ASPA|nr:hypothetical protein MA16_Dca016057 [Dendrobium catenatum]